MDHSVFYGWGGGAVLYGGASENFRAKREAIPKIEGGRMVMQVYVLVLREALKGKLVKNLS